MKTATQQWAIYVGGKGFLAIAKDGKLDWTPGWEDAKVFSSREETIPYVRMLNHLPLSTKIVPLPMTDTLHPTGF